MYAKPHNRQFYPDMGLKLGTSVVVKEMVEGGNAFKNGVKLGDQLFQVCPHEICIIILCCPHTPTDI